MRVAFLSLSCIALAASGAMAQDTSATGFDPAAAIQGFLTDAATLGADTATLGKLTEDGDTVTVENVAMHWSVPIEAMGETVTVDVKADMPSLSVKGLAPADGGGHTVSALDVPAGTLTFSVTGAPEPITYTFDFTNYSMADAEWGAFPKISADPAAPVSRFAPLVDWAIAWSYQSGGFDKFDGTFVMGEESQKLSYGPMTVGPVVKGKVDLLEYPPFTISQTGEVPQPDGTTKPVEMRFDYGAIRAEGLDLNPFGKLLTGNGAATGMAPILSHVELDGITVKVEGEADVSVASVVGDDLTIDTTRGPLLKKLDPIVTSALAGTPPSPPQLIGIALDVYGAYGVGRYQISDIAVSAPDTTAQLALIAIEELNNSGLGRFAIEGAAFDSPTGKGKLDTFEIRDLTFPAREVFTRAVMGAMNGLPFNPATDLAAIPTLGGFTIKGLSADAGLPGAGPVKLDLFDISLSGFVTAIPTQIAVALEGFELPLALVQDPQASMILSAVGADPVTADMSLTLDYDESDGSVTLDKETMVGKVGALTTVASLTGIPKVIFENPMRANEAIATAAVRELTVRFKDDGITSFLVGMMSEQAGIGAADFAQGMAQQVEMQVSMLTGDGNLAGQLAQTVRTYLADPRSLLVSATPAAPVALAQIIGAAMAAPQQIPQLLNLTVTANP